MNIIRYNADPNRPHNLYFMSIDISPSTLFRQAGSRTAYYAIIVSEYILETRIRIAGNCKQKAENIYDQGHNGSQNVLNKGIPNKVKYYSNYSPYNQRWHTPDSGFDVIEEAT